MALLHASSHCRPRKGPVRWLGDDTEGEAGVALEDRLPVAAIIGRPDRRHAARIEAIGVLGDAPQGAIDAPRGAFPRAAVGRGPHDALDVPPAPRGTRAADGDEAVLRRDHVMTWPESLAGAVAPRRLVYCPPPAEAIDRRPGCCPSRCCADGHDGGGPSRDGADAGPADLIAQACLEGHLAPASVLPRGLSTIGCEGRRGDRCHGGCGHGRCQEPPPSTAVHRSSPNGYRIARHNVRSESVPREYGTASSPSDARRPRPARLTWRTPGPGRSTE